MKISLLLLGVFLVLINFLLMYFFNEMVDRLARCISTLIFFLIYIIQIKPKFRPVIVFSLFLICDAALIFYEDPAFMTLTYISRMVAYSVLILNVSGDLKRIKFGKVQGFIAALVIALNVYMVTNVVDMVPEATNDLMYTLLFYVYVLILLVLAIVAISYHSRYSNLKSFYYLCACFSLIFSDLLYFILYYLHFEFFKYADRFFNIIGLMCFVVFLILKKDSEYEENHSFVMR